MFNPERGPCLVACSRLFTKYVLRSLEGYSVYYVVHITLEDVAVNGVDQVKGGP